MQYRGTNKSKLDGLFNGNLIAGNKSTADPFTELINQIDSLLDQIPSLVIPSNIFTGNSLVVIKQIIERALSTMNVGRFGMIACSVANLIARHSGNKSLSNISGFIQNCMAIYSIGDSINSKLKLRWNYTDAMYMTVLHVIPEANQFSIDYVEQVNTILQGANVVSSSSIPLSSAYALVKMFKDPTPFEWVDNGNKHTITPLHTNVLSADRKAVYNDNGNQENNSANLVFKMNPDYNFDSGLGGYDASGLGARYISAFVFKFDNVVVYLRIPISSKSNESIPNDIDDSENSVKYNVPSADDEFTPAYNNVQLMWLPDPSTFAGDIKPNETTANILSFISMMFARFLDTKNFVFSVNDEYELYEIPRPKNIPTQYVSDKIDKIVSAISVMHDKNLSRGFAFVGYPGTGKTIAAQQISNYFSDVCTFKLCGDIIEDSDSVELLMRYVKAVRKCIIIVDDMDSSNLSVKNESVCRYLDFFDKLNMAAKNDGISYVFLATVNDPSKVNSTIMKRSGRIDEMIEIGYPNSSVIKYLFNYNDAIVNPDKRTDFDDERFDDAIKFAVAKHVTAADITNIFSDIVIYNANDDITPEMVIDAVNRIASRNAISKNNYLVDDDNADLVSGGTMLTALQRSLLDRM